MNDMMAVENEFFGAPLNPYRKSYRISTVSSHVFVAGRAVVDRSGMKLTSSYKLRTYEYFFLVCADHGRMNSKFQTFIPCCLVNINSLSSRSFHSNEFGI